MVRCGFDNERLYSPERFRGDGIRIYDQWYHRSCIVFHMGEDFLARFHASHYEILQATMTENEGDQGAERKRFGERAGGNFLQPAMLRKDGVWNDVEVVGVKIIPGNDELDIVEADGLVLKCPDGRERDLRLNVRNTSTLREAIPDLTETDGKSVVGKHLVLSYNPDAGRGKPGITIVKVL